MKSFIKTLSIALFSAFISLFIYDRFVKTNSNNIQHTIETPTLIPTSYSINTNTIAAERTDFTEAAAKTIDAVVHVKNTSSSGSNQPSFYQF